MLIHTDSLEINLAVALLEDLVALAIVGGRRKNESEPLPFS